MDNTIYCNVHSREYTERHAGRDADGDADRDTSGNDDECSYISRANNIEKRRACSGKNQDGMAYFESKIERMMGVGEYAPNPGTEYLKYDV